VVFRDVEFPDDEISIGQNGELTLQHFLNIYVNDTEGKIMEGANISIESKFTSEDHTTDGTGWINNIPLTEYTQTSSGKTYDENFSITVSMAGYFESTVDVRMDVTQTVMVTLTPLPDPYVEEDDIDVPLAPNEGDLVLINVSVHNIGEDASVKVRIYLEYKDDLELLTTVSLILKDGITSYVEAEWDSTNQLRGDRSIIVEIENRTADRNTTNNSADKDFTLHARPIVNSATPDDTEVFRLDSVKIEVEGEDHETDEEDLTLKVQAHPSAGGLWDDDYFSTPWWDGDTWITNFTPAADAELEDYDFRFRFTDENNGVSIWFYRNELIFVMNNLPEIQDTIPDFSIEEDTILVVDLTEYEGDREDSGSGLNWFIHSYKDAAIDSITGQNSTGDELTFTPQVNFTGNTSVWIVLVDLDGGTDTQLFHIEWTSVNDAPIREDTDFSTMEVSRTSAMIITINATDDNTTEEDLDLDFQLQREGDVGWTDVGFNIQNQFVDDHWVITITPSITVDIGNYSLRFNITDDTAGDEMASEYYYHSIKILNNPPEIEDITPDKDTVLRTGTIVFTLNGTDTEDTQSDLQPVVESRYKKYAFTSVNGVTYDNLNDYWTFSFTPGTTTGIGNYTFRAMFIDTDAGGSDWKEVLIVVENNHPSAIDLDIGVATITLNNTIFATANGVDVEDLESKLTPYLELRAEDGEAVWFSDYVTDSTYDGSEWVFTIHIPENATLGDYSFRVYFEDEDGDLSNIVIVSDGLHVINNAPVVLNMGIPLSVERTETATLYANADCDLDEEDKLDPEFEYYHLGQWWDTGDVGSFLGEPQYENIRWEVGFTPSALDSSMSNYSFRVRFKLRESEWSGWFKLQNGTTAINSNPEVLDLQFNDTKVYRGNDITVTIIIEDAEDPLDQLDLVLEYSLDSGPWETTYLSATTLDVDHFTATFSPPFIADIGNYTFRVMGTDTEDGDSEWFVNATLLWVMNNAPYIIGGAVPDQEDAEDNSVVFRLTQYEGDKETENIDLIWAAIDYDEAIITKIIHNPNYDQFTLIPADNFTGTTVVTFRLKDSDGDSVLVDVSITWTSVNDEPIIERSWSDNLMVYRDETLTAYIVARDDDDPDGNLTPILHYSRDGESWINASVTWEIMGSFQNGTIIVNHTVPITLTPGNYSIRVKVQDRSGNSRTENSTWYLLSGTIEIVNHDPEEVDIQLLDIEIYRTDTVPVYVDALDTEDDLENLSLILAYSYDHNETTGEGNWTVGYSGNVYYDDVFEYVVIEFTPGGDALLGTMYLRAG